MKAPLNQPVQGLRGVSIFLVFLSHWYAGLNSAGLYPAIFERWHVSWFNLGKYGVELFFMISGFVIVKSLRRHANLRSFLIDRVARIYPLFFVLHLGVFVGGPLVGHKFFHGVDGLEWLYLFVVNLLLLPGVFDLPLAQIVAWSLSYEIAFYLLAGAAWQLWSVRGRVRAAGWLAWALATAALVWMHPRMLFFLPGVAASLWGAEIAMAWRRIPAFVVPVAGVAMLACWASLEPASGDSLGEIAGATPVRWVLATAALVCGALVFWHVALVPSRLNEWLGSRGMVRFGDASYSFYLWHLFAVVGLRPLYRLWIEPRTGPEWGFWLFGALALAAATAVSFASRRVLELQAGEWLRGVLHRRWPAAARS